MLTKVVGSVRVLNSYSICNMVINKSGLYSCCPSILTVYSSSQNTSQPSYVYREQLCIVGDKAVFLSDYNYPLAYVRKCNVHLGITEDRYFLCVWYILYW